MLRTLISVSEIVYQVSRHRAFNSIISLYTPVGIPQADSGVGLGRASVSWILYSAPSYILIRVKGQGVARIACMTAHQDAEFVPSGFCRFKVVPFCKVPCAKG